MTIGVLTEAKKAGQFRAFWKDFNESVNLMASGETVIQSMWSPAVTAVRTKGIALRVPAAEGRLSLLGLGLLHVERHDDQAAGNDLRVRQLVSVRLGRRLSQPPGLLFRRAVDRQEVHGSLTSGPIGWKASRPTQDIHAPDGTLIEKAGAVRDGGSYDERMGHVACWNSVMDENDYMVRKWNEFIAA